ncbi:hypothetical protein [Bradyrhizobium sp.]|uniref:hypothetical protein n=1 Tax=Bradyrhizobium sp. TaxID=376 RepID=UPI002CF642A7|nr:hypothetical protein [Bradyrhizobium sp.]HMM93317.1 hypothetical protein [Bradyrhizobium sp.]
MTGSAKQSIAGQEWIASLLQTAATQEKICPRGPRKVVNAKLPKRWSTVRNPKLNVKKHAIRANFTDCINQSLVFHPDYAAPVEPAVGRME